MIDLHTHTTASDGRCTPTALVARASKAGVTVLGVTDHDTVAGCDEASAACAEVGVTFVPGIEITAVCEQRDVHVLGYFIDRGSRALLDFLVEQRQQRIGRVRQIVARLTDLGIPLDGDALLAPSLSSPGISVGRPWIARALVRGGFVRDTNEAFDRWLAHGRPAFVPRLGAPPAGVFEKIHEAGGIASLAHPGLVGHDEWIDQFAAAGLDALEAYHTDHDPDATARYLAIAERLGLAVSGGSDYHADDAHGASTPGSVSLPAERFATLKSLARSTPSQPTPLTGR